MIHPRSCFNLFATSLLLNLYPGPLPSTFHLFFAHRSWGPDVLRTSQAVNRSPSSIVYLLSSTSGSRSFRFSKWSGRFLCNTELWSGTVDIRVTVFGLLAGRDVSLAYCGSSCDVPCGCHSRAAMTDTRSRHHRVGHWSSLHEGCDVPPECHDYPCILMKSPQRLDRRLVSAVEVCYEAQYTRALCSYYVRLHLSPLSLSKYVPVRNFRRLLRLYQARRYPRAKWRSIQVSLVSLRCT